MAKEAKLLTAKDGPRTVTETPRRANPVKNTQRVNYRNIARSSKRK